VKFLALTLIVHGPDPVTGVPKSTNDRFREVGSPAQVADGLEQLRDATGADELIITTITHGHADRVRSYEMLAGEWQGR
jgi:alkanesulfonate monooxygenase SsuD/methylene tetrahydromethanopterin reductase-like flavin-dependent oxidoreductase (luciferase family)